MLTIEGKLIFDPINVSKKHTSQATWKKVAICKFDCDITDYYSWFLVKRFSLKLNKPLRGPHVTIISDRIVDDVYLEASKFFNDKIIRFEYDPSEIRTDDKYWWIKMYSDDVKNIRTCMGLPDPYWSLHMTIGYANELNIEHSKYIHRCIKMFNL